MKNVEAEAKRLWDLGQSWDMVGQALEEETIQKLITMEVRDAKEAGDVLFGQNQRTNNVSP